MTQVNLEIITRLCGEENKSCRFPFFMQPGNKTDHDLGWCGMNTPNRLWSCSVKAGLKISVLLWWYN